MQTHTDLRLLTLRCRLLRVGEVFSLSAEPAAPSVSSLLLLSNGLALARLRRLGADWVWALSCCESPPAVEGGGEGIAMVDVCSVSSLAFVELGKAAKGMSSSSSISRSSFFSGTTLMAPAPAPFVPPLRV